MNILVTGGAGFIGWHSGDALLAKGRSVRTLAFSQKPAHLKGMQAWVLGAGLALPSPERYKVVRRWYANDRARSTLDELLDVFPQAA